MSESGSRNRVEVRRVLAVRRGAFSRWAGRQNATQDGTSMRSALQNGGRDTTEAPTVRTGPVIWRGQRPPSWPAGKPGPVSPDGAGTPGQVPDDASLAQRSKADADA